MKMKGNKQCLCVYDVCVPDGVYYRHLNGSYRFKVISTQREENLRGHFVLYYSEQFHKVTVKRHQQTAGPPLIETGENKSNIIQPLYMYIFVGYTVDTNCTICLHL